MEKRVLIFSFLAFVLLSGCCLVPKEVSPQPGVPYLAATPPRPLFSVWMLDASSTNAMTCIIFAPGNDLWIIRRGYTSWEYCPWEDDPVPTIVSGNYLTNYYEKMHEISSRDDSHSERLGSLSLYRSGSPVYGNYAVFMCDSFFADHPNIRHVWMVVGMNYRLGLYIVRDKGVVGRVEHTEWREMFTLSCRPYCVLLENVSYEEFMKSKL